MDRSLYCFRCSETKLPHELNDNDTCHDCGSMVELCEWDFVDEVWVPVPPGE